MRKDISEHDKAGSKAYLPHANAAQQYRKRGISIYARRADVNERGCLCCHGGPSFERQIGGSKRAMGFDALYKQRPQHADRPPPLAMIHFQSRQKLPAVTFGGFRLECRANR